MQHMTRQCQWYNNPGWEVEIERQTFKAVLIRCSKLTSAWSKTDRHYLHTGFATLTRALTWPKCNSDLHNASYPNILRPGWMSVTVEGPPEEGHCRASCRQMLPMEASAGALKMALKA